MWKDNLVIAGIDLIFALVVLIISFTSNHIYIRGICLGVDLSIIVRCIIKLIIMYHNNKKRKKEYIEFWEWLNEE